MKRSLECDLRQVTDFKEDFKELRLYIRQLTLLAYATL